jgi:hypothetical protein
MSANDIALLLDPHSRSAGTAVDVVVDSPDLLDSHMTASRALVESLGKQLATLAADWTPPVTVRIGAVGASAIKMKWLAPIVYEPRLSPIPGRINLLKDFQGIIGISFATLPNLAMHESTSDLIGAVTLSASGDQPPSLVRHYFLVSGFRGNPIGNLPGSIRGSHMILLYSASADDVGNTNAYYARIDQWQNRFRAAGATARSFELATLTTEPLLHCQQCFQSAIRGK